MTPPQTPPPFPCPSPPPSAPPPRPLLPAYFLLPCPALSASLPCGCCLSFLFFCLRVLFLAVHSVLQGSAPALSSCFFARPPFLFPCSHFLLFLGVFWPPASLLPPYFPVPALLSPLLFLLVCPPTFPVPAPRRARLERPEVSEETEVQLGTSLAQVTGR